MIRGGPSGGTDLSVAALPIIYEDDGGQTIADGATLTSELLPAENLPGVNLWALQTAGPGVITVHLEFANGNEPVVPNTPQWRRVIPAFNLVINTELLINPRLGSRLWRVRFVASGGQVTLAGFRLTASLS